MSYGPGATDKDSLEKSRVESRNPHAFRNLVGGEATAVAVYAVRMPWYPWTPLLGAASIVALLATTWFVEGMRVTLLAGIPWQAFISICYFVWRRTTSHE